MIHVCVSIKVVNTVGVHCQSGVSSVKGSASMNVGIYPEIRYDIKTWWQSMWASKIYSWGETVFVDCRYTTKFYWKWMNISRKICIYPWSEIFIWQVVHWFLSFLNCYFILRFEMFLVFNATFSNISATCISMRPVLVVEEAGVPRENHRRWASNW